MLKKLFFSLLLAFLFYFVSGLANTAWAVIDPLSQPNNRVGIHILDPNEVEKVPDLVNAGGDWGWVTVVLRDDDKDRAKWQHFMDNCARLHLIPLVRLGTVMTPNGWETPNLYQSLDLANFLNDLSWPTQNRYVVVYNEPNHASEWGGQIDPGFYAYILKYTSQIFKERNEDFFILPAGLDAAAPNGYGCQSLYSFLNQMVAAEPDIFNFVDGWTSHAYANPGFSGNVRDLHQQSIISYRYETEYVKQISGRTLPVFVTEAGWEDKRLDQQTVASFYQTAFTQIWQDSNLVVVTPFLFNGQGPFTNFSLIRQDGSQKPAYAAIKNLAKTKGQPQLAQNQNSLMADLILGAQTQNSIPTSPVPQTNLPANKWQKILSWIGLDLQPHFDIK